MQTSSHGIKGASPELEPTQTYLEEESKIKQELNQREQLLTTRRIPGIKYMHEGKRKKNRSHESHRMRPA